MNIEDIRKNPQATYLIGLAIGFSVALVLADQRARTATRNSFAPAVIPCGRCAERQRQREFETRIRDRMEASQPTSKWRSPVAATTDDPAVLSDEELGADGG